MTFAELTIGQCFRLVVQGRTLPLTFRKTELHGTTNCASLWQPGQECPARTDQRQEVQVVEET